jgi:ABC-type antimicrobial peptide transport system permease subunit
MIGMMRLLPLHHAIRNVSRRPVRSLLLLIASGVVTGLLVATSAFVRSLEASNLGAAPPNTAILISTSAMGDIVRSAMSPAVADLAAADVPGVVRSGNVPASSPEIHMGTELRLPNDPETYQAFVRGVTERAFLVHESVTLVAGRLPGPSEALVGRLAADKCGLPTAALKLGTTIHVEGGSFRVAGVFAAPGTTVESEIWLPLSALQGLIQRNDCSCVFVRVSSRDDLADVDLFAKRRLDLELVAVPAQQYYAELTAYFDPILALAWTMTVLISIAATTAGANTVIASVQGRIRELATLRAIGFRGSALAVSVLQETLTLGMAGALLGLLAARLLLGHVSVSMAMTAFRLEVDSISILIGLGGMVVITLAGATPALFRILRLSVARALKES